MKYTNLWLFFGIILIALYAGCTSGSKVVNFAEWQFDPDLSKIKEFAINKGNMGIGEKFPVNIKINNVGTVKNLEITKIECTYTPPEEGIDKYGDAFTFNYPEASAASPALIAPEDSESTDVPKMINLTVTYTRDDDSLQREAICKLESNSRQNEKVTLHFFTQETGAYIEVQPLVIDFGAVKKDDPEEKKVRTAVIYNTGGSDLNIKGIMIKPSGGGVYYTVELGGQTYDASKEEVQQGKKPINLLIQSNKNTQMTVKYDPQTGESATAKIMLTSDAKNAASTGGVTVIDVKANYAGPKIKVEPTKAEFNATVIGGKKTIWLKISSVGDSTLEIKSANIKQGSSSEFDVDYSKLSKKPVPTDPLSIPVNEFVELGAVYSPDDLSEKDINNLPIPDKGFITIENNTFEASLDVELSGWGVLKECPTPVVSIIEGEDVIPQTVLHIFGDQSQASCGNVETYEWKVTQPPDNKQNLIPSTKFPNPTFTGNVAGDYMFCLDICDSCNKCSSDEDCATTSCKQVRVSPDQAIHVELTWDTPNDPNQFDEGPEAGSDLDLHFAHPYANSGFDGDGDGKGDPWFDIPYDSFWFNKEPEWGSYDPNMNDNPSLDRDDTDGAGPENLNIDGPENGKKYRVGVHYWDDHGYGPSTATVKIYIWKILIFKAECQLYELDMWDVASIDWPSGAVTMADPSNQCGKITQNYVNPSFTSVTQ
jgi:hypothetical protein